jgi:ankyrin repeat protein
MDADSDELERLVLERNWSPIINVCDKHRKTTLHYACQKYNVRLTMSLLDIPGIITTPEYGPDEVKHDMSLFHLAVYTCSMTLLTHPYQIIDDRNKRGISPLHMEAQIDWIDGVNLMLDMCSELAKVRDLCGLTLVLYASIYSCLSTFRVFLEHDNPEIVRSISLPSQLIGWTVLHCFTHEGHHEILKLLLEKNLEMPKPLFSTVYILLYEPALSPLNLAGWTGNIECVALLLAYGVNPNAD